MLVFAEGGKPENPEKNPRSREENQHKFNPLMASGPGIDIGGRRVLLPRRLPCSPLVRLYSKTELFSITSSVCLKSVFQIHRWFNL